MYCREFDITLRIADSLAEIRKGYLSSTSLPFNDLTDSAISKNMFLKLCAKLYPFTAYLSRLSFKLGDKLLASTVHKGMQIMLL
jgi:hypothetical protein